MVELRASTIIAVIGAVLYVVAAVSYVVGGLVPALPLFALVFLAVVVLCFLDFRHRAPGLDEGVPEGRYREVLASASAVSFVSILITLRVAWWPKEDIDKLGVLLLLLVFLPYAFIPLRLYGHRLRSGLTLAMSVGGALFVPGIYLIRFAITWDNRWWVLGNLIVAELMQLLLVVVALTAYIGLPRLPRRGIRVLAAPAYGFCLFALFLLGYSPVPRHISHNEKTAIAHLDKAAERISSYSMLYPEAVGNWGPNVNLACTAELDSTLLPLEEGYVFEYRGVPPSSTLQGCPRFIGFIMTARPVTFGKTGIRSFSITEEDVEIIHFTSENRPAMATDPAVWLDIGYGERPVQGIQYHPNDPTTLALQQALSAIAPGKIAFESPASMRQSESRVVHVRISKNVNEELEQGLAESGNIQFKNIKVAPVMSVRLGGSAFKIDPITPEQQAVGENDYTGWSWMVHPLDSGQQFLRVSVCAQLDILKTRIEPKCAFLSSFQIEVKTDPIYAATHFIKDDPKWSVATEVSALGFIFAGLVTGVQKLKRGKEQQDSALDTRTAEGEPDQTGP